MQTVINEQEANGAIVTGLKMLNSEIIMTPNAWNIDLANLQKMLAMILSGAVKVVPVNPIGAGETE